MKPFSIFSPSFAWPAVSPSSTCARRSGPSTALLRRSHDRLLDRVRRRGAALGDLALGQFGGLVDDVQRHGRRVHSQLLGDGVDLLLGLRLRGGGGLVDLRGRRGFGFVRGDLDLLDDGLRRRRRRRRGRGLRRGRATLGVGRRRLLNCNG